MGPPYKEALPLPLELNNVSSLSSTEVAAFSQSKVIPSELLASSARRAQHDRHSIKLGASRCTIAKGADMEVVSATTDVLTERVGAGELVGGQDAHRFDGLMCCYCVEAPVSSRGPWS